MKSNDDETDDEYQQHPDKKDIWKKHTKVVLRKA